MSSLELFNKIIADTVGNPQKFFLSSESENHLESAKDINEVEEDIDDANIVVPSQSPNKEDNTANTSCTTFLTSLQRLLQFSVQEIEKSKQDFRRQLDAKDQIISSLKEKLEAKSTEIENTKGMMNGVIEAKEKEIETLKVEVMSVHQITAQIKQQYSETQRQFELKERENKILAQQISSSASEKEKLVKEIENMKRIQFVETEKLQATIGELSIEIDELKQKNSQALEESQNYQKQLGDAQKHIEILSKDLQQALSAAQKQAPPQVVQAPSDKAKDAEIKILKARLESKEAEIQSIRFQTTNSKFTDLNWKNNWEKELEKMKTHLLFKEQEIKTLTEQLHELQQKLGELGSPNPSPNSNDVHLSVATPIDENSKKRKRTTKQMNYASKAPKTSEATLQLVKVSQALTPMRSEKKAPVQTHDEPVPSSTQKQLQFS